MSKINCWCGNSDLDVFSPDYKLCSVCGTLVYSQSNEAESSLTTDENGFYGKDYWFKHQTDDLNHPDLFARSREDLSERTLYWLRSVLRFCLPPAKSLEIGSAHGGFVALLRQAGFDTAGLELSPWVVRYAEENFQIPMYLGPVEDQKIEPGSLDLIIMMDVLEHFEDPLSTVQHCLSLLKPDGKLFIQTPEFDRDYSFTELQHTNHIFLNQLKPVEHVYLFGQKSIEELFHRLGVDYITFIPPCFPYDMFLVASKVPLPIHSQEEVENALLETSQGRIALALLDIDVKRRKLETLLDESEVDRSARLDIILESEKELKKTQKNSKALEEILHESETDRANRLNTIQELETKLKDAETDRVARLSNIHELETMLKDSEADRAARLRTIQELETKLKDAETDRATRLRNIHELETLLKDSEADRAARLRTIQELEQKLDVDQRSYEDLIREMEKKVQESIKDQQLNEEIISKLEGQRIKSENDIFSLTTEHQRQTQNIHRQAYFIAQYEQELSRFPVNILRRVQNKFVREKQNLLKRADSFLKKRKPRDLKKIAIDLTPILPGGENGGAKLLATTLVWQFSREVFPECEFVLLTSDDSHNELSWLDTENVQRICVNHRLEIFSTNSGDVELTDPDLESEMASEKGESHQDKKSKKDLSNENSLSPFRRIIHLIGVLLERILPRSIYHEIYQIYRSDLKSPRIRNVISDLNVDLLFCPFTAPLYYSPGIPTVIVVHDLQFLAYPQFFKDEDIYYSDIHYRKSCQVASLLICVSEFTRQSVLQTGEIAPDRVEKIHTSMLNPLEMVDEAIVGTILEHYQIEKGKYLLYPANFWPHKNHEMLLTAFNLFIIRNPNSPLKLVLTGAPGVRMEFLRKASQKMGLEGKVIFAGFVNEQTLSAFFQCCLTLVFPSLYEGFGVPVLEAMSFEVPVLSSNLSSLPEVGGDAFHYFDPRKPDEIFAAIEKIVGNDCYRNELVEKGVERSKNFFDPTHWAAEYFKVFKDVVGEEKTFSAGIFGKYPDHWVGDSFDVTIPEGEDLRLLELCLELPEWSQQKKVKGSISINGRKSKKFYIERANRKIVRVPLNSPGSRINIELNSSVQPKSVGIGEDSRYLSTKILWCRLLTSEGVISISEAGIE